MIDFDTVLTPPATLRWHHAADEPFPEREGERGLLVWDGTVKEVRRADWSADGLWHTPGGDPEYMESGTQDECLWWAWADGRPMRGGSVWEAHTVVTGRLPSAPSR